MHGRKIKRIKHEKNKMGFLKKILFIVIVAGIAWIFFFNGTNELNKFTRQARQVWLGSTLSSTPTPTPTPTTFFPVQRFEDNYGKQLISYTDPYYGFFINYPIGYAIVLAPELGVQLRISAMTAETSELIEVRIGTETAAEAFYANAVNLVPPKAELKQKGTRFGLNGKKFYYINSVLNEVSLEGVEDTNILEEKMFVRQNFFDCLTPEGERYAVAITALIPETLSKDVELADYVINTFQCA